MLWDLHARGMNAVFGAPVNAYRASLGLPAVDNVLIDDQDDCLAVGEVNQQALFRRVADQLYWAARVADLGIGVAHDGPVPTAGSLSAALGTALAPETVARATAVAGVIRTDGAIVAAKLLLDYSMRSPARADGGG